MKKILLAIFGLTAFATAHAQQTVIVQKTPGLLEGIVDAAVAVATAPVVFGTAIVSGVEEVFAPAVVGRTHVTILAQPAVVVSPVPPSAVIAPPAVVAPVPPVVVAPQVVSPECCRAPHVSTTTITTQTVSPGGAIMVQSYTRPISAYEMGIPSVPVPIEHRVGTAPYVNPYVFRYR